MKTGTTYVQNLLDANRAAMAEQGWLVPAQRDIVRGVRQVLDITDTGPGRMDAWHQLTAQVREWPGAGSMVSMEFLSYAGPRQAQRIVEDLHGLDLRVVLTVRDAAAALPSQWQSLTRNRGVYSWPDFARQVRRPGGRNPSPAVRAFRRTQDIPRMIRVWSSVRPAPRLTVVLVPPRSQPRALLWTRLLSVPGLDPAPFQTDVPAFQNPRLGYGSCDLLRRVNAAGLRKATPSAYRRVVRYVARNHLLRLRDSESTPRLDLATARFAANLNRRTRGEIERYAELVGDLEELPQSVHWRQRLNPRLRPPGVSEAEVLRAATAARAGMFAYLGRRPDGVRPTDVNAAVGELASLMLTATRRPGPVSEELPDAVGRWPD